MWKSNSFGGGVAWRENELVKWKKGLDLEDMLKLNKELPMPFVLHFRVPSTDTSHSSFACHPFGIDDDARFDWEGETAGSVLFHNGFWNDWRTKLQNIAISGFVSLPSGPWSDSRGLAWAANHLGLGFLEMVNEKVVVLGPEHTDIEIFGQWSVIKNEDADGLDKEILVSNKHWERHIPSVYIAPSSPVTVPGGTAGKTTFQGTAGGSQRQIEAGGAVQEQVQEGAQGVKTLVCFETSCRKQTNVGQVLNTHFYCMQCWAKRTQRAQHKLVGICETCKVNTAAVKISKSNNWICSTCWETNNKPEIYFVTGGNEEFYD